MRLERLLVPARPEQRENGVEVIQIAADVPPAVNPIDLFPATRQRVLVELLEELPRLIDRHGGTHLARRAIQGRRRKQGEDNENETERLEEHDPSHQRRCAILREDLLEGLSPLSDTLAKRFDLLP